MNNQPLNKSPKKRFSPDISKFPMIMGIVNTTPDSFSDGGRYDNIQKAEEHALRLEDEGADVIDLGGESSRPFADPVSEEEEIRRVVPLISRLSGRLSVPISVDTTKSVVARLACEEGARIINDISAMTLDPDMLETAAQSSAAVILMHMLGEPRTMQVDPFYKDVKAEIIEYLKSVMKRAEAAGIPKSSMIIDPGLGFGKTVAHNLALINAIPEFKSLDAPVLIGPSRKSFIQKILQTDLKSDFEKIEAGTLSIVTASIMKGADILRVHDVKAAKAAAEMIKALKREEGF